MLSRFCRNVIKKPQFTSPVANKITSPLASTLLRRNFCVYRNLQSDIGGQINLNNQRVEQMRMEFSELRELQKKFFWRLSEESTLNLFKVRI
jgi:hypothetical protein